MQCSLTIGEQTIPYTVRVHPRARRVRLAVRRDGAVVVTRPERVSVVWVERWVHTRGAWIVKTRAAMMPFAQPDNSRMEYLRYKARARAFIVRKVEAWNAHFQFSYSGISVRNQATRWGSCSQRRHLSFHYRLATLPEQLSDYVIVHELCHLQELNHSPRFWHLVAGVIPDYRARRVALRAVHLGATG